MLGLFLAVVGACSTGSNKEGLGPDDDPIAALAIQADSRIAAIGEVVGLASIGVHSSGARSAVSAVWSAQGGSITPGTGANSNFVATSEGDYMVVAWVQNDPALRDSVVISVSAAISPTVDIRIEPLVGNLQAGDSLRFTVEATRSDGSTYVPTVTFAATGGSITADGLYTAGTTAGFFRVIAILPGGALADTASVTISTGGGGGPHPNEPPGMTALLNSAWDSLPPALPARNAEGWGFDYNTQSRASVFVDPSAPESPSNVLRMSFPQGFVGGSSPVVLDNVLPVRAKIYVSMWERRSAGWSDNGNAGTKRFYLNDADISAQSYSAKNSNLTEHVVLAGSHFDGGYVPVGQWVHFEFLFVCNTPGVADGSFDMWVNGQRWFHLTGIRFVGSGHRRGFSWLQLSPTYGGGGNPVPKNQFIDIDQFYVSGAD